MTTQEIADRLVELVNQGKNVDAEQELYAQDVISHEPDGRTEQGLDKIIEKTKNAFAAVEEMYGGGAKKVFVNQDTFLVIFEMDVKYKGGERMQMTEYGFYRVADGKVVEEYFYF